MTQVQIFIDKNDLIGSKPIIEFIMPFLLDKKIQGATVFKGWMGFGKNHILKSPNTVLSFDEVPMLITFIDEDDKAEVTIKALRDVYQGGLIVKSNVQMM